MRIDRLIQLKAEEEIVSLVHQTLIPALPRVFMLFLWIVIPFFFLFPLFRLGIAGAVIFLTLVGSGSILAVRAYWMWRRTVFVVTDRRVIDIDQKGFFDRTVSEVYFTSIEDVSYRVHGVIPTIFRFGSVLVKTAGTAADVEITSVRNPARIHDLLNDLRMEEDEPEKEKEPLQPHVSVTERDAVIKDLYAE